MNDEFDDIVMREAASLVRETARRIVRAAHGDPIVMAVCVSRLTGWTDRYVFRSNAPAASRALDVVRAADAGLYNMLVMTDADCARKAVD